MSNEQSFLVSKRIEQAKELVEAWRRENYHGYGDAKDEALISAIATAECDERAAKDARFDETVASFLSDVKSLRARIAELEGAATAECAAWSELEQAIANLRLPGVWRAAVFETLRTFRAAQLKAVTTPSGDDEQVAQRIVENAASSYDLDLQCVLEEDIAAALITNRSTLIRTIEAKRDGWEDLRQRQPEWGNHVRAANEILDALK